MREVRRYLGGALAARTGDEMSGPALLLLGVALTGEAVAGSALLAGLTGAAAVGGPLVGALLDRSRHPGRLLAWALGGYAAGFALIALAVGRVPLPLAVGAAVAVGLLGPVLSGGWTAQLPRVVPPERRGRADAWDAMTFGAAALLGPALAGAVAVVAGAGAAAQAAAVLIALAVPAALALPAAPAAHPAGRVLPELWEGVRAVLAAGALRRATAASSLSIAGTGMLVVCAPLLGLRLLGGAGQGALLLSAMAVCSLAANLLLARRPGAVSPDVLLRVCVAVQAAGTAGAALAASPIPLLACLCLVGAAEGPQLTALFAIRHREAPDRLRARVFTTGASLKISAFAAGAALAGPLAQGSLPVCLGAAAALHLAAALVPHRHRHR
ncbi:MULTISPECIES: MFS transporter [unclassified Nocardiopsis]|uniref:MFS transporter n=1 Tax=Nocardiopsis TaxID=2013 RepID=UPI00387B5144